MILYQTPNTHGFTIGGKAKGLFQLHEAGIPVPDFLVIPAEMFDSSIAPQDAISAEKVREKLLQFSLPDTDQKKIERILKSWDFPEQPVVVRSSVAEEDSETSAFAGMMDSFLNLSSLENVFTAVSACAGSAYSERVMAYRQQKKLQLSARPAVIIQKQIEPE